MHLSIHSDCFVPKAVSPSGAAHRGHFDSLVRGFVVLGVATLLGGLTVIADMSQHAGAAPRLDAASAGAAVNLMHREVIGR